MLPRKQRNRDQQPELQLVDQQSEQSAGAPARAAARLGPASPDAVRDR
jgi:hypothetical protein